MAKVKIGLKWKKKPVKKKRVVLRRKQAPLVKSIGSRSLQCSTRINRASRRLTMRNPLNNRFGNSVVPQKYFTTLPYFDRVGLSFSTLDYAEYVFRVNSLFDPNLSGTGHQPRGFDQLSSLYRGYQVYGVAYDITFFTKDTSKEGFKVGVVGTPSAKASFSSSQEMSEYTVGQINWTTLTNEKPVARLRGYLNASATEGVSRSDYNDDDNYKAGIGANPAASPKLFIVGYTLDGTTATQGVECNVNLLYFCKFQTPQFLVAS